MPSQNLYDFYTSGGIRSGLRADGPEFILNNRPYTIFSGAIHYFRVHPDYWRDRLQKAKECGLNCIETYIPWNMHEPKKGYYDFGEQNYEMSSFCQLERYIRLAKEEDLFVIIRPGPYICAEWEFGGMPSYLLREENIQVRTSDPKFIGRVEKYFERLFQVLRPLQFTLGGPIIAFQIENEYGNVKEDGKEIDAAYLEQLKEIMEHNGVQELMFTSDTPSLGFHGTIPGVLATANFQTKAQEELKLLKEFQPGKPLMVMEFWTGWFDHWTELHESRSLKMFEENLEEILKSGASVNFYMFHGGTNWGFLNGANNFNDDYQADTTSYDYDCLLSESGQCTEKYYKAKELIAKYSRIRLESNIRNRSKVNQGSMDQQLYVSEIIPFQDMLRHVDDILSPGNPIPMEKLPINDNSGQSYGYIVYRKTDLDISNGSVLRIEGEIRDQAIVLINGEIQSTPLLSTDDFNNFGFWRSHNAVLTLKNDCRSHSTLDILVINWGRINFGKLKDFKQFKGLHNSCVYLDEKILCDWKIIPLEFKKTWTDNLSNWTTSEEFVGPAMYKFTFESNFSGDCFINMDGWYQGIVIINGFVLGRYCHLGPQKSLYLPKPFLKEGASNTILVFEHFKSGKHITLFG